MSRKNRTFSIISPSRSFKFLNEITNQLAFHPHPPPPPQCFVSRFVDIDPVILGKKCDPFFEQS